MRDHRKNTRLIDERRNDPHDEVPVLAQAYRYHRLNVEYVLSAVVRSEVELGIVLKRHADEAGHRILDCLCQSFRLVFVGRILIGRSLLVFGCRCRVVAVFLGEAKQDGPRLRL